MTWLPRKWPGIRGTAAHMTSYAPSEVTRLRGHATLPADQCPQ